MKYISLLSVSYCNCLILPYRYRPKMIGECEKATEKLHLVVLVHGLWGNRSHMDEISKYVSSLNDKDGKGERILVHQAHLNEGYKTYDGIDVCGIRVAKEIEEQLNVYGSEIVKFSLIGYSLGGLSLIHI